MFICIQGELTDGSTGIRKRENGSMTPVEQLNRPFVTDKLCITYVFLNILTQSWATTTDAHQQTGLLCIPQTHQDRSSPATAPVAAVPP